MMMMMMMMMIPSEKGETITMSPIQHGPLVGCDNGNLSQIMSILIGEDDFRQRFPEAWDGVPNQTDSVCHFSQPVQSLLTG